MIAVLNMYFFLWLFEYIRKKMRSFVQMTRALSLADGTGYHDCDKEAPADSTC